MKTHHILSLALSTAIISGCYTNIIDLDAGKKTEATKQITAAVDMSALENISGLTVESLYDSQTVSESGNDVTVIDNGLPQLVLVKDGNDNFVMMARDYCDNDGNMEINVQSTALALVTMHPLFAPTKAPAFHEVKTMIASDEAFGTLCNEVAASVSDGRDIFDTGNSGLVSALNDVLESLCSDDDTEYEELPKTAASATKAGYDMDYFPFFTDISGTTLTVRNTNLTPPYTYNVFRRGNDNHFDIFWDGGLLPSRDDYGILDILKKSLDDFHLGEPITISMPVDGDYHIKFDCTTDEAADELRKQMLADVLSMLGMTFDSFSMTELGGFVAARMGDMTSLVVSPISEPMDATSYVSGWLLEGMSCQKGNLILQSHAKAASKAVNLYNGLKGSANEFARALWALSAPKQVNRCLTSKHGQLSSCKTTLLVKINESDNQEGFAGQALLEPIMVSVKNFDPDGNLIDNPDYEKVKFEVITGGGSVSTSVTGTDESGIAKTTWTLGETYTGDTQTLKATVIDAITGEAISNEVTFTAKVKANADITVRLDWIKDAGDTDIDLHVIDPYGEEIYYSHTSSASGGWLDRDDTVGPGPEHIYWENAPAGVYTVKVHHYYSDSRARINYTVTTFANGKMYRNTGLVGFDEEVTVGYITIPEASSGIQSAPAFRENGTVRTNVKYEKKKNNI